MGRKRKSEDSEEEIRNKIRKLKSKLQRRTRYRSRIICSDSEMDDDEILESETHDERSSSLRDHVVSPPRAASPPPTRAPDLQQPSSRQPSTQQETPRPDSPRPGTSSAPVETETLPQVQSSSPEDQELDDDILLMLGDAPKPEMALGNSIHKDVANRWQEILLKGLQKEVKENLLQEYLVPSNCSLLMAPTLNPEAKAALPDALVKRDHAITQKQTQLGVALAALAKAVDVILKQDSSAQKILKPISDACRILCDSHYLETKTRRYFVLSSINANLKDTLSDTTRNAFLFGDNVTDKLKAAQSIQKFGDTLKNTPKPFNKFNKNNFIRNKTKSQKNLNFKPLHRRAQSRADAGQYSYRPPPPPRSSRPTSDRRRPSSPQRRSYRSYRK